MAAVAPGSYPVVAHPAIDIAASQMSESMWGYNEQARVPLTARTHAGVCRFFGGLEVVEPGVVQLRRWRPGAGEMGPAVSWPTMAGWAGSGERGAGGRRLGESARRARLRVYLSAGHRVSPAGVKGR